MAYPHTPIIAQFPPLGNYPYPQGIPHPTPVLLASMLDYYDTPAVCTTTILILVSVSGRVSTVSLLGGLAWIARQN